MEQEFRKCSCWGMYCDIERLFVMYLFRCRAVCGILYRISGVICHKWGKYGKICFFVFYGLVSFPFWYVYAHCKKGQEVLKEYNRRLGSTFLYRMPHQLITFLLIVGSFLVPLSVGILFGIRDGWGN